LGLQAGAAIGAIVGASAGTRGATCTAQGFKLHGVSFGHRGANHGATELAMRRSAIASPAARRPKIWTAIAR
jgi:hypothetical protein